MKLTSRLSVLSFAFLLPLAAACGGPPPDETRAGATSESLDQSPVNPVSPSDVNLDRSPDPRPPISREIVVDATNNDQFSPRFVVVPRGGYVIFRNTDTDAHTVTSGSPQSAPGRFFDYFLAPGQTIAVRFDWPGIQPYFCKFHADKWMMGTVLVVPRGGPPGGPGGFPGGPGGFPGGPGGGFPGGPGGGRPN